MKKVFSILVMILMAMLVCGCTLGNQENNDEVKDSYVSLDINPSIEIIVSKDNKVVNIYAKNDDAKVLLAGEVTFVDTELEDAVKRIVDLCVEYGYLTEENSDVNVTVSSPNGEETNVKLENTVSEVVAEETKGLSFAVSVSTELTEELKAQYEEVKAELAEGGLVEELTIGKFKLIESAVSSDPTLSVEVAVNLDEEELIKRIEETRDEMYNVATTTYNELVTEAQNIYEALKKSFERGKYAAFYTANFMKHPVNYGVLYAMYGTAADSSQAVLDMQALFDKYSSNILTDEQIEQIVSKMTEMEIAIEEVKAGIKDEEGNVTIESVKAYLDKVVAEIEDETLKAKIEEIRTILASYEELFKEQSALLEEKYIPQLKIMLQTLETSYAVFETAFAAIQAFLPQSIKDAMATFNSETETLITTIKTTLENDPKIEDLESWVETFRAKEAELLEKMKAELTAEEIAQIEATNVTLPEELVNAETEFLNAKEEAKAKVEAELLKLKEERKNK